MKIFYLLTLLCFGTWFTISLNAQNTPTPNYDLAARFSPDHIEKMVFSTSVDPHWLKSGNQFWYMYETSAGKQWYLVDATQGTKTNLFDNVKIAAEMSRLTGDPFDAQHMDIENLKFMNNEKTIRWEVKSKLIEVDEELDEDEEEDDMEKEEDSKDKKKKKPKKVAKIWYFDYDRATQTLSLHPLHMPIR